MYTRQRFEDVNLDDQSLVDRLIDLAGDSFIAAEAIRIFVCYSQEKPDLCLRTLMNRTSDISAVSEQMLMFEYDNVDQDILALVERNPFFESIDTAGESWSKYHTFHRLTTIECLNTMNTLLHFNICNITASYYPNVDPRIVECFDRARGEGKITSALMYACRRWPYHLSLSAVDGALASLVVEFLRNHSLHWLEVVSLIRCDPVWSLRPLKNLLTKVSSQCIIDAIMFSHRII